MVSRSFSRSLLLQNHRLKLAGIEKYNNEDSYVVKGEKTYYYSVKTGLKTVK
jgi:hypothetical protein